MSEGARRILESLREVTDGTCSGEGLSSQLGVSRAQVWKHVSALRKRGYTIEGAPGGGYRLISAPDKLYADEITRGLTSQWLGQRIEHFDETDSTNRGAAGLAREGAAHGTAVIAESQTAGRGRLGRRPAGRGHVDPEFQHRLGGAGFGRCPAGAFARGSFCLRP